MQIGRTHQNPLVGRDKELAVLRTLLHDAEQSTPADQNQAIPLDTQRRPQCILLIGEAGIGKTRLAEEMSREAEQHGWTVLWSRAYIQGSSLPYHLWTEVLRKALPHVALSSQLQPLTILLPELQIFASTVISSVQTPEQEQLRLWEATLELLTMLTVSGPLLIVLDDIQWADASSCELLTYLARHLHGFPILLVGTCRENEITTHPLHSLILHMQREHSVQVLPVKPLTSEQIGRLVSSMPNLPGTMVQHIQEQSAGNPFFAEELARVMPTAASPTTRPITAPPTITAALASHISRLSSPCRQLLEDAAVLGGSFELSMLFATESALTDEDTVLDLLEEALQAGILMEEGSDARITYSFWHPLLVSHLYDDISIARRTRLHGQAAHILQHMYRDREEEGAATIMHHLVQSGAESTQIARYAELAGNRAYTLSAYPEAEQHYRVALQHATQAPSIYLLERLAECTMILGDFQEARRLYERILAVRSDSSSPYEAQIQALLWGEIGLTWRYEGDNARARACCTRGEQVLREAGVNTGPAWPRLRYQQSNLYWQDGCYQEAQHAAQEALALFEQQQSSSIVSTQRPSTGHSTRIQRTLEGDQVDLGRTHQLLAAIANSSGQRSEALAHLNTALAIFEQHDHKRQIAHVSCNLGYIHLKNGAYLLAEATLRRSLSLAERVGDTPLTSVIFSNLGELAACSGDLVGAEVWYKKSLTLAERFNDREYMSMWNIGLATVVQEQGRLDEAVVCIIRALRIGRAMHNNPCIGNALVAMGKMRVAQASKHLPITRMRLLTHAREDIQRALSLEGLAAETRTQGQLTLVHVEELLQQP